MTDETPTPAFTVKVDQNRHLALGERTMHAIVRIEATGSAGARGGVERLPSAAEVIIIDVSSSMTGKKITEACRAAAAAVEALREGTEFAVVAGHTEARQVYPPTGGPVPASDRTRAEAVRALEDVRAHGGTSMSTWLLLADELLARSGAALKHVLLLTDGQNTEGDRPLLAALEDCAGRFVCDCRGVGVDWSPQQVDTITHALNGKWKPVASPDELAEDFRSVINTSMSKRIAGVSLHVKLSGNARIAAFGEVLPTMEDLTDKGTPVGSGVIGFPLGSWGDEVREYALRIEVDQSSLRIENGGTAGAALLQVMIPTADGGLTTARTSWVFTVWTSDIRKSALIDPRVAGYLGQQELQRAVQTALDSLNRLEDEVMTADRFGRAVALAYEFGRHDLIEHLSGIVYIDDPVQGRIRMRPRHEIERSSLIWSDHASSQTTPVAPARAVRKDDEAR